MYEYLNSLLIMIRRMDGPSVHRVHVSNVSCFSHFRPINDANLLNYANPIQLIMNENIILLGTFSKFVFSLSEKKNKTKYLYALS